MIKRGDIDEILSGIIEKLASTEHERWSHWQRYMHSKGAKQADGSLLLPAELVEQWERQSATKYENLTAKEQASDREQVDRYLPLISAALKSKLGLQ